jgi:hypothetical protein
MMAQYPWRGAALRITDSAYQAAGQRHILDPAIIRAVFSVESAGRPFRADGTVERRYEPHHMPGSGITNWRDSLKLPLADREARFGEAYRRAPEAAMDATSWGGPQIMGFNAEDAGYSSARAMVEAMAADEQAHLDAFMALIAKWGLVTKLRAHDWLGFASRYNGPGQASAYAAKIERAYRAETGKASPAVLRIGSRGAAVRRLQRALGIADDGQFGSTTRAAVIAFQSRRGMVADGIVGAETWAALNKIGAVAPESVPKQNAGSFWAALAEFIKSILGGR